jgi:hypothetical protein
MNEVVNLIHDLELKGWTDQAIADELGVDKSTLYRWKVGMRSPTNAKPIVTILRSLLARKRIPKKKRYKVS